jgi:hypothetical protein
MGNPIAWVLGVLGVLRTRRSQSRTRGRPGTALNSAVPASSSAPEAPRGWRPNPNAARWVRWARQAERLRWSGRGPRLLPEEACWGGRGHGRRVEAPDRGRWEAAEHPVRAYVLASLSDRAIHG